MSQDIVIVERDDNDEFVTVTLNRPDKMNALNVELSDRLEEIVLESAADPTINAMILTGSGRAFSTGFDLQGEDFEMDVDDWREDIGANCRRFRTIWEAPIPVIAAVNGYALAGGLELMMVCDLAIAAEDAQLGEPEVRHVSGPPSLMMPWTIPMRHARWLMYTGDMIDGREAERIHLVNKAVPAPELMAEAKRLARKLARVPVPAIQTAKMALNNQQELAGLAQSWEYNRDVVAELHAGESGRHWMGLLKKHSLKEFLSIREAPFKDLD
jgi:enoyl-CoA hydratase